MTHATCTSKVKFLRAWDQPHTHVPFAPVRRTRDVAQEGDSRGKLVDDATYYSWATPIRRFFFSAASATNSAASATNDRAGTYTGRTGETNSNKGGSKRKHKTSAVCLWRPLGTEIARACLACSPRHRPPSPRQPKRTPPTCSSTDEDNLTEMTATTEGTDCCRNVRFAFRPSLTHT